MTMQDVIEVLRSQQYDAQLADCTALRANMQLHCCSHTQRECSLFTEGHKDMCSNTLGSPEHVPSCDIESTQAIQVSSNLLLLLYAETSERLLRLHNLCLPRTSRAAEIGHVVLVPVKCRSCHEPLLIKAGQGLAEELQAAKSRCKPQQRLCMSADLLTTFYMSPAREAASVSLVTWTRSLLLGLCSDHLNTSDTRRK